MSETKNKKNYEMTQLHYITDGKEVTLKPIYDKNGNCKMMEELSLQLKATKEIQC